jgi:hypothetical protein
MTLIASTAVWLCLKAAAGADTAEPVTAMSGLKAAAAATGGPAAGAVGAASSAAAGAATCSTEAHFIVNHEDASQRHQTCTLK